MGKNHQELEEKTLVSFTVLDNGLMLLTFEDGTTAIVSVLSINDSGVLADALESTGEDEDEDEDEDDEDEDDEDEDDDESSHTKADIMKMDFEELEDLVDEEDLDIDTDDYDEDSKKDLAKLRKKVVKEMDL